MTCNQCGRDIPEGSAFCPNCGAKASAAYAPKHASPVWGDVRQPQSRTCPNCGKVADSTSVFCGYCGSRFDAPAAPVQPVQPVQPAGPKTRNYSAPAKKTKVWIPITAGVALVVVIALVISMLSSLGGPLLKIGAAAKKTFDTGNFTIEYELEVDGEGIEGILYADIDVKNREVAILTTVEFDGEEGTIGIYDGYLFMIPPYGYSEAIDIEDQLDEIFDTYEDSEKQDLGELLEQIDELLYDYTGEELSDYFDLVALEEALKTVAKDASKEKWLKENAGFSKDRKSGETLYTFEPSLYDLIMAVLPYFEDSFEDSDIYDDLMDELDNYGDDLDDDVAVTYTFGVKSGYLSTIDVVMDVDGEEIEGILKISDVNKTKLDLAELEDLLDEAR
jgi:RNA polymerase subunit RPABC4/transcription elongation factor Spt4